MLLKGIDTIVCVNMWAPGTLDVYGPGKGLYFVQNTFCRSFVLFHIHSGLVLVIE